MPERKGRQTTAPTGTGKVRRRGEGLGTGPVGTGARQEGTHATGQGVHKPTGERKGSSSGKEEKGVVSDLLGAGLSQITGGSSSSGSGSSASKGLNIKTIIIVVVVIALLSGGGAKLLSCLGTGNNGGGSILSSLIGASTSNMGSVLSDLGIGSLLGGSGSGSFLGSTSLSGATSSSSSWLGRDNNGVLNSDVASGTREKYTTILGKNRDVNTIMVYMCGSDLETKYGMASSDLSEMAAATVGDNVNLIIYTNGCSGWKTSGIQNDMILKVEGGKLKILEKNTGHSNPLSPDTLAYFIQYCKKYYSANRYDLILWDHGGGSVSGYGYDDRSAKTAPMTLDQIATALKKGGVKFDFVGFDACLMATAETALMLEPYADYLIASEESEPGIGWYYTNWLTKLSSNSSMETIQIGKLICDDFVSKCAEKCPGQSTTLSVIDVAEFSEKVPAKLKSFANATTKLITGKEFQTVATARASSREFASANRIDQIDLVHFALNLDTDSAKALADTLLSAIKYNKTSRDMANSYGVSIFFPYSSTRNVDSAIKTYNAIGVDSAYSKCIKEFATMEVSGQVVTGGTANQSSSILGLLGGGTNTPAASSSGDILGLLTGALGSTGTSSTSGLGDVLSLISGLGGRNVEFLTDRAVSNEDTAQYIATHLIDISKLNWKDGEKKGSLYINLSKEDWALITDLQLSMYYDDGQGYIDLGMDNVFDFDDYGHLLAPESATWLTLNGEVAAYYFEGYTADGAITGYIPALLDGELVNLIVRFDKTTPAGKIVGARPVVSEEIGTVAKNILPLDEYIAVLEELEGKKSEHYIELVADYYDYKGNFLDSYRISDPIPVSGGLKLGSTTLDDGHGNAMYRFTDIYGQFYWTEAVLY